MCRRSGNNSVFDRSTFVFVNNTFSIVQFCSQTQSNNPKYSWEKGREMILMGCVHKKFPINPIWIQTVIIIQKDLLGDQRGQRISNIQAGDLSRESK